MFDQTRCYCIVVSRVYYPKCTAFYSLFVITEPLYHCNYRSSHSSLVWTVKLNSWNLCNIRFWSYGIWPSYTCISHANNWLYGRVLGETTHLISFRTCSFPLFCSRGIRHVTVNAIPLVYIPCINNWFWQNFVSHYPHWNMFCDWHEQPS